MNLAFRIARRYFKSKKSIQAIHIISWISMGAIAVSAAAMIILFSVFNGLESTIKSLFTSFYPDIKVQKESGKFFNLSAGQKAEISSLAGVEYVSYSIEDMVLLANESEQKPAILKGTDEEWFRISGLSDFMLEGKATWEGGNGYPKVIMGLNIAFSLKVDVNDAFASLNIYYPRSDGMATYSQHPESALKRLNVKPSGLFHIQEEFDDQYILAPLETAREIFGREQQYSSIEIKKDNTVQEKKIIAALSTVLGNGFAIQNRYQQNKTLYFIMQSEKWAVYAILLLVLIIASFNMIGSLSMLVLEKRKDIFILKSMGASPRLIRSIFLFEGLILALSGGLIGVCTGFLICLAQKLFGFIRLPDGFLMSAYPVEFKTTDFVLVVSTALVVGFLAAWYPARKAATQSLYLKEE